jgi:hypothetical protein
MVTEASIGAKVVLCILLLVPEHKIIPTKGRFVGKGFENGVYIYIQIYIYISKYIYIYISYPQYFQVSNLFASIVGLSVFHIQSCGHQFLSQLFFAFHRTGAEAPRGAASQAPIDDLMGSQWDNGNIMEI